MTASFTTNGNTDLHKTSGCFGCGESIFFDGKTLNPKTGKLQRFDPETKQPHRCDPVKRAAYQAKKAFAESQERQQEEAQQALASPPPPRPPAMSREQVQDKAQSNALTIARHSQARLKIFRGTDPVVLEGLYNKFANEVRSRGGREKGTPSTAVSVLKQGGEIEFVLFYYYDLPNENTMEEYAI